MSCDPTISYLRYSILLSLTAFYIHFDCVKASHKFSQKYFNQNTFWKGLNFKNEFLMLHLDKKAKYFLFIYSLTHVWEDTDERPAGLSSWFLTTKMGHKPERFGWLNMLKTWYGPRDHCLERFTISVLDYSKNWYEILNWTLSHIYFRICRIHRRWIPEVSKSKRVIFSLG